MGYVYRYRDKADNIIKYVGIVWSENRTLSQRIKEHKINDIWTHKSVWEIEYLDVNINSRTDAEYFESHYVSLYGTGNWYNKTKVDWGISSYLPDREKEWKLYKEEDFVQDEIDHIYLIHWTIDDDFEIKPLPVIRKACKRKISCYDDHCKRCGSNNIYKKETKTYGQLYCKDCGAWVAQGNKDNYKWYTPDYNGEFEKIDGEYSIYNYYTILYGRKDCWKTYKEDDLLSVRNGCVTYAPSFKDRRRTSIHTYALNYDDIEKAKKRIINYVKKDKEDNIEKIQKEIDFLKKRIESLPTQLKEEEEKYQSFLNNFSEVLLA